jgi:hypothetical protein
LVSTAIGTNKSFLEQGINPNTVTSPEPTGSIFNAAKAFNEGLKKEEPSAENTIKPFFRGSKSEKSKQKNTQHQEKQHSRGFAYSVWESVLKSWSNALLTSSSAETIVNAITGEGEAKKLSTQLDRECEELKQLLDKGTFSSDEQKEQIKKQIEQLEKNKHDPNTVEYNSFNRNLEKTFADSFLSRLITDIAQDQCISAFRRKFPEFSKKFPIINTFISDVVARPSTFILRTVTAENNILTNASNHAGEVNPQQQAIIEAMKDTGVAKLIHWIRGEDEDGNKKVKLVQKENGETIEVPTGFNLKAALDPFVNFINKYLLGITAGETLKDEKGQTLYTVNSLGEKKEIKSLAKFNPLHFGFTSLLSLGLTNFTLDKKAQATGFQDANTPLTSAAAILLNSANRIDSAMTSYAHSSVRTGSSFMDTFHDIIPKKLIMPFCQALMKGLSNLIGGDMINPVTKSILLNIVLEFTAPPFVQSFMKKSEKGAIDKDTQFVAHTLIKPILSPLVEELKKCWMWWGKNFHAAVGTYPAIIKLSPASSPFWLIQKITCALTRRKPKDIPHLFDEKKEEVFQRGLPSYLSEYKNTGLLKTALLAIKSLAKTPLNVTDWFVKSNEANKIYSTLTDSIQAAVNLKNTLNDSITRDGEAANKIIPFTRLKAVNSQ